MEIEKIVLFSRYFVDAEKTDTNADGKHHSQSLVKTDGMHLPSADVGQRCNQCDRNNNQQRASESISTDVYQAIVQSGQEVCGGTTRIC